MCKAKCNERNLGIYLVIRISTVNLSSKDRHLVGI